MKKWLGGLAALGALVASTSAAASDKFQRVEFFGSYGQLDVDGLDADYDGIGGGLRIVGGQRVGVFGDLQAEYIPTELDSAAQTDLDIENYRAGIGFGFPAFGEIGFFQLKGEYVSLRTELESGAKDRQSGFGVHVQVEQDIAGSFGIDASVGYLGLDDVDGTEFTIGFHWVPDTFGFFTQFRWANLDGKKDGIADVEFSSLRVGFRVPF